MTLEFIVSVFIVHIIECCIVWQYFKYIFSPKIKGRKIFFIYLLGYLTAFSFSLFDSLVINTIIFSSVNLCIALLVYNVNIKESLFQSLTLTATMNITEWAVLMLLGIIFGDISAFREHLYILIILIVLSKTLFFLFMQILSRIVGKKKDRIATKPSGILLLCSVPAVTMIMGTTMMYIGLTSPINDYAQILVIVSTLLMIAANIAVFIAYHKNQELSESHYKSEMVHQKENADSEYYKMLDEQYEGQRILIHDIRKHLQTIKDIATVEKADDTVNYISQIEKFPSLQRKVRICSNTTLNLILIRYADKFKAEGVDFHLDVRDKAVDFVNASDLSAIFGNILDNAYEAVIKAESGFIDLMVERVNNRSEIAMISMVNSCPVPPQQNGLGEFITLRTDKKKHGLGIKSINAAAKKYDGTVKMYFEPPDSTFHTTITLVNNKK